MAGVNIRNKLTIIQWNARSLSTYHNSTKLAEFQNYLLSFDTNHRHTRDLEPHRTKTTNTTWIPSTNII